MTTVTRRFVWDAAHRLLNHDGNCRFLHGHRYVAEVTCKAPELNALGMVIDFSIIKQKVGDWINSYWDHNTIINQDDKELFGLMSCLKTAKEPFRLKHPTTLKPLNPTVENLAFVLYEIANNLLNREGVNVIEVKIHETENCFAIYKGEK